VCNHAKKTALIIRCIHTLYFHVETTLKKNRTDNAVYNNAASIRTNSQLKVKFASCDKKEKLSYDKSLYITALIKLC